jgi:hypothetical protein
MLISRVADSETIHSAPVLHLKWMHGQVVASPLRNWGANAEGNADKGEYEEDAKKRGGTP